MAIDTAAPNQDLVQTNGQFSTFFVADMFFGVDVLDVQEVLRAQQMSPVPQAPDVIEGLINLRGQIVTAIDMRRRLLLEPRAEDEEPMNMVVRTSDGAVSLLVDEIGDVLDTDATTFERPPDNLDPAARELIRGVYKLKNRLLLVLDTEKAVEVGSMQTSRRGKLDGPSPEGASARRRSASQIADAVVMEPAETAQPQKSAKNGTKKVSTKKTAAAARGGQAERR
jgi:purine-binding chemotaxis protein CheW